MEVTDVSLIYPTPNTVGKVTNMQYATNSSREERMPTANMFTYNIPFCSILSCELLSTSCFPQISSSKCHTYKIWGVQNTHEIYLHNLLILWYFKNKEFHANYELFSLEPTSYYNICIDCASVCAGINVITALFIIRFTRPINLAVVINLRFMINGTRQHVTRFLTEQQLNHRSFKCFMCNCNAYKEDNCVVSK